MVKLTAAGRGHLLAIGTIIVWGETFISSTVALRTLSPIELLAARMLVAILALLVIAPRRLKLKSRKHEWYLMGAGLSGVTLYFLFENLALTYTSSANCSVIVSTAPFFVAVAARLFLNEAKLSRSFFIGFAIAMAGVCMVSYAGHSLKLNPLGDALCILAAIMWAAYCVFIRKLEGYGYNTLLLTRRIFVYGLLFLVPVAAVFGFSVTPADILNRDTLLHVLFLGLVASALCFVTWNIAVRLIGPVKTSVYIYLVPTVTIVCARVALNDAIHPLALAGAGLTLVGLVISQRRGRVEAE